MHTKLQKEVIALIEVATNYAYPIRWVDEKTTLGDFDGREYAIDVFRIPVSKQIGFLRMIRPIRNKILEKTGHRGMFIFHTPEATKKHYSHLFPIIQGLRLEDNGTIKLPLPDIGGLESKPEILVGKTISLKLTAA